VTAEASLAVGSRPADRLTVLDPATGLPVGEVADLGGADARRLLDRAADAADGWAAAAPRERGEILRRAYELMQAERHDLAAVIASENGKPLAEALGDVDYAAEFVRWYSEEAVRWPGTIVRAPGGAAEIVVRSRPIGVCLLITPWNVPAAMVTRKIAPALAAGCTVILKPAEQTPLTAQALVELFARAGLPDGVLNLLTTSRPGEVTEALLADRRLRKLSFTGSTRVGIALARRAADRLVRCSLELGGNAPFIALPGSDPALTLDALMLAKMRNGGMSCVAADRIFVHRTDADWLLDGLIARMAALRLGPATDPASEVGPMISDRERRRLQDLLAGWVADGARILLGGRPRSPGFFLEPTVVVDVPARSRYGPEEVFGPVAPVVVYDDVADVVTGVNAGDSGLAGYVCGPDPWACQQVADALDIGMVAINRGLVSDAAAPFGGVKSSGLGHEGGPQGLAEYLQTKYYSTPVVPAAYH
jgi:succinate-semialdehyde dehydrogenase/glutarate-semialdehyde dehydrogenase